MIHPWPHKRNKWIIGRKRISFIHKCNNLLCFILCLVIFIMYNVLVFKDGFKPIALIGVFICSFTTSIIAIGIGMAIYDYTLKYILRYISFLIYGKMPKKTCSNTINRNKVKVSSFANKNETDRFIEKYINDLINQESLASLILRKHRVNLYPSNRAAKCATILRDVAHKEPEKFDMAVLLVTITDVAETPWVRSKTRMKDDDICIELKNKEQIYFSLVKKVDNREESFVLLTKMILSLCMPENEFKQIFFIL